MVLYNINHKMTVYKDCTFGEMMCVGCVVFLAEIIISSGLTYCLFGYAFIGVAITFITFIFVVRFILGRLQTVKYGKPYGFYQQLVVKKLQEMSLLRSIYVTRKGRWTSRRFR